MCIRDRSEALEQGDSSAISKAMEQLLQKMAAMDKGQAASLAQQLSLIHILIILADFRPGFPACEKQMVANAQGISPLHHFWSAECCPAHFLPVQNPVSRYYPWSNVLSFQGGLPYRGRGVFSQLPAVTIQSRMNCDN